MEEASNTTETATASSGGAVDPYLFNLRGHALNLLPLVCFVGIVGNCMALTLIRTNFYLRRLPSNVYLCVLSVSSCIFLSAVLVTWIDSLYALPLYSSSALGCKLFTWLAHGADYVCVWMIGWISCDRCIVLYRPRFRRWVCTARFARRLAVFTVVLAGVLYSWCLAFAGIERFPHSMAYCGLDERIELFGMRAPDVYFYFTMFDTAICTIVPSVLIVVVNAFSVLRYRECMRYYETGALRVRFNARQPAGAPPATADDPALVPLTASCLQATGGGAATAHHVVLTTTTTMPNSHLAGQQQQQQQRQTRLGSGPCSPPGNSMPTAGMNSAQVMQQGGHHANNASQHAGRLSSGGRLRSSDLQLSRSLLIVTSFFVLLNVPSYLFRLAEWVWAPRSPLFSLLVILANLLCYTHHAVLFYMYIFWSPQMKKQLRPTALRLLECYCCKSAHQLAGQQHSANSQLYQRH